VADRFNGNFAYSEFQAFVSGCSSVWWIYAKSCI